MMYWKYDKRTYESYLATYMENIMNQVQKEQRLLFDISTVVRTCLSTSQKSEDVRKSVGPHQPHGFLQLVLLDLDLAKLIQLVPTSHHSILMLSAR